MIALVTYNRIFPYERGLTRIDGTDVLVLPETFTPKSPANVVPADPNWQELMLHRDGIDHVIIFAGKKSSGALEIIDLACDSFEGREERLFFVLCDHEFEEKRALLERRRIPRTSYVLFEDGHLPCQEAPIMKGYLQDFLDRSRGG